MANWTRVRVEVDWAKLTSHTEFGLTADATYSSTLVHSLTQHVLLFIS